MPEQDYIQIPNQPGFPGSPTQAQIEADDLSGQGVGPFRQRVTIADTQALEHAMAMAMAGALAMAIDPASGRLRILVDQVSGNINLGSINQIMGFGSGGINPASTSANYLPFDITSYAWSNTVRRLVT